MILILRSEEIQNEESIDDNTALKKEGPRYSIVDKSIKSNNYLKIGNKILDGASGKPTSIVISASALQRENIEAAGNGLFALGRSMKTMREAVQSAMKRGEKAADVWNNAEIIIGLNLKSANSFYAQAKTGFQNSSGKFTTGLTFTLIPINAVVPNPNNTTNHVNVATGGKIDPLNAGVNGQAMPSIADQKKWRPVLKEVDKIDASNWISKYKDKKVAKWDNDAQTMVKDYVNTFFVPHINSTAARYKAFLRKTAQDAGIDPGMFNNMYASIESWKKSELGNKEEYLAAANQTARKWFEARTDKGAVSRPVMKGSGKVIKGQEGSY
jgi:hypothetical protein